MKKLETQVWTGGRCSGCGMCVAACPIGAIRLIEHSVPAVDDTCTECGICVEMCPRTEMPYAAIEKNIVRTNQAVQHDDLIGYYTRIVLAQVRDDAIRTRSYWGGATTAFLTYLLEQGHIDSALLTDKVHNCFYCAHPKTRAAKSSSDILACAFTKPTINPLLSQLPVEGTSVAMVGTSCHIFSLQALTSLKEVACEKST